MGRVSWREGRLIGNSSRSDSRTMSALGRKPTFARSASMSALCQERTFDARSRRSTTEPRRTRRWLVRKLGPLGQFVFAAKPLSDIPDPVSAIGSNMRTVTFHGNIPKSANPKTLRNYEQKYLVTLRNSWAFSSQRLVFASGEDTTTLRIAATLSASRQG